MNAPLQNTPNSSVITMDQLMEIYGVETRAKLVNCLEKDGIKYLGRGPRVWTTIDAINGAMNLSRKTEIIAEDIL